MGVCGVDGKRRAAGPLVEEVRLQGGRGQRVAPVGRYFPEIRAHQHKIFVGQMQNDGFAVYLESDRAARILYLNAELRAQPFHKFSKCHIFVSLLQIDTSRVIATVQAPFVRLG